MAEQVNERIEDMINELEEMQRIGLYTSEEIREISRKRKEYEYKIQRQTKCKEDYANYIAYEYALLEDITLRRKKNRLYEKRKSIEFGITRRLNKNFNQLINRFKNDIEVYFQYIKFCQCVGFDELVSGVIGQMLQVHGDKAKMWQMAAKWEQLDQNNLENARNYLLKGIHRHPESSYLYLDLFNIELLLASYDKNDQTKEKQLKRADIVWKNGIKNVNDINFLFELCNCSIKFDVAESVCQEIKNEIWSRRDNKDVWAYIADMELRGHHWQGVEEFVNENSEFPEKLNIFISVYEEALLKFPDEKLFTKYIHTLLGVNESSCSERQKIEAVRQAWMFGHEHGLLSEYMYDFGIEMLKIEAEITDDELLKILEEASKLKPKILCVWKEKVLLNKGDDKKMLSIVQEASKLLENHEVIVLWNILLDNVASADVVKNVYKRFQSCEHSVFLALKPKLLEKTYEHRGLKAARDLYDEFIRTPPIQIEVHTTMINIEEKQAVKSYKNLKKCYEGMVRNHGADNYEIWLDYINFESKSGKAMLVPNIYANAIRVLKKELVDEFIKRHTLDKLS